MDTFVKTGYMRVVGKQVNYLSFKEFLSYDRPVALRMRERVKNGELSLFCACSPENNLELSITETGIVRVKNNKLQELHQHSCPKSIHYHTWVNTSKKGMFQVGEDGQIIFNITLPSVIKSESCSSSSTSSSKSTSVHTSLLEMISSLNAIAWEKQTFSKKKAISLAKRNNVPVDWFYKTSDEFIRLIFGVSNDIFVKNGESVIPFYELCYRKDVYYANTDFRQRFFIYAEIVKESPYVEERKYQYITLKMYSDKGSRSVVRILTEHYLPMFEEHPVTDNTVRVLAGYINRSLFQDNDWMTLLKGFVIYTSLNGLYAENDYVAAVFNYLSEKKLIFKRCYQPIEAYGGNIPTLIIERLHGKDILVDFVATKQMRSKRYSISKNQNEYDVFIFLHHEYEPEHIYQMITKCF